MKQNDWIVANINNPNFSITDFKEISGLDLNNTQFLDKDEYKKSKFITENPLFQNQDGQFNEKLFDQFYDYQAQKFNEFVEDDSIYEREYNFQDVRAGLGSNIRDFDFRFINVSNPDRTSFGVAGRNIAGTRTLSKSELAQTQKIRNSETGEFYDETPNDSALFRDPIKFLTRKRNLVLATYDEDTDERDPITGLMVHHKKGDPILNNEGTYFAETLGNRSPRDKQFITARDLLTVEGTKLNKYDFLDTDSISKDPWKVVADTIASVLPMLVLGPYGQFIYSGLIVGREMMKSAPMLTGMVTSLADKIGTNVDAEQDFAIANTIAGWGQAYSRGSSEYAQEHMFSFENFGNLISDVALQWGQQKAIVKAITKIKGNNDKIINAAMEKAAAEYASKSEQILKDGISGKLSMDKVFFYTGARTSAEAKGLINAKSWSETPLGKAAIQRFLPEAQNKIYKATRLGQDLSLAYMAIISNADVYDDAIQHGVTRKEAAAIALGSSLGMFAVDRGLGLGEMFFDDSSAALRREITANLKNASKEVIDDLAAVGTVAADKTRKPVYVIMQNMLNKAKKGLTEYAGGIKDRSLEFMGKAIGEGLEEMSEELVTDLTKTIAEIAGDYGYVSVNDLGAFDNALPRYVMNFLGGFIGGGMFYAVDAYNGQGSFASKVNKDQLLYLISTGKTKEIINQLDKKFRQKSEIFGNYDLSFSTANKDTFVTADNEHKSQAETVYNTMRNMILMYDNIINNHKLKVTEDELFDKLVLSEANFIALKDRLQGASYFTHYQQDYRSLINQIVKLQEDIDGLRVSDTPSDKVQEQIDQLQLQLNDKLKLRDEFLSGQKSLDYLDKLLWLIDTDASGAYVTLTQDQFSRKMFGASYDELSDIEKQALDKKYNSYIKSSVKDSVNEKWEEYKKFRKRISTAIDALSQNDFENLSTFLEEEKKQIKKFADDINPNSRLVAYDGIFGTFEEETEEEFKNRQRQENETDEEFAARSAKRMEHYNALQQQRLIDNLQSLVSSVNYIDSNTARKIQQSLNIRVKDVFNDIFQQYMDGIRSIINQPQTSFVSKYQNTAILESLESLLSEYIQGLNFKSKLDLDSIQATIQEKIKSVFAKSISDSLFKYKYLVDNDTHFGIPVVQEDETSAPELDYAYTLQDLKNNPAFIKGTPEYNALSGTFKDFADKVIIDLELTTDDELNNHSLGLILDELNNFDEIVNTLTEQVMDNIKQIQRNPIVKLLSDVDFKLAVDKNPAIEIIKAIASRLDLNDEFNDIEETLKTIYDLYQDGKTPEQFVLTDSQTQSLKTALDLLEKAKGVIYSSTVEESLTNPIGQHKQLNKIVRDHSDLFTEANLLPEFDESIGNSLLYEISKYQTEIKTWLDFSESHRGNRLALATAQKQALINTQLKFQETLAPIKITTNGFTVNILDDFENGNQDIQAVVLNQQKIKQNFDKAVEKYMSEYNVSRVEAITSIFDQIFDQNIFRDPQTLKNQKVAKLDENLNYDKLSDYDKLVYLITSVLGDQVKFYNNLKEYINTSKEGPLFTQVFGEYITETALQNKEEISAILDLLKSKYDIRLPIAYNTVIITGIAGSGKSSVLAKYISTKYDSAKIAIAGPSSTQTENLSELIPNLDQKFVFSSLDSLINHFVADDVISKINTGLVSITKAVSSVDNTLYVKEPADEGNIIMSIQQETSNTSFFKKLKEDEIPELLIVDESTYLSHPHIQLLSMIAKKRGIDILLIGDEAQNGHPALSIEKDTLFGIRTPRLDLSLRAANNHQYYNQKQLSNIFDTNVLDNFDDKIVLQSLKGVQFTYLLSDDNFTGTSIINPEEIDSYVAAIKSQLKERESVLFVGENSPVLSKLEEAGIPVTQLSEKNIQGQEKDYVVIDVNWNLKENPESGLVANWIKRLNTLITRSKKGTILINHNLTDTIKQSQRSTVNTEIQVLGENEIKQLKASFLQELSFLDNIKQTEEEKQEGSNPEPIVSETEETTIGDGTESYSKDEGNTDTSNEEVYKSVSGGYRVYGNISTLGVARESLSTKNSKYPLYEWKKELGTTKRDVGIFVTKNVKKGSEKESLVSKYLIFKNFLLNYLSKKTDNEKEEYLDKMKSVYDTDILRVVFGKSDYSSILQNAKFYVEAKNLQDGYDNFIGMTTANDKESIEGTPGATLNINGNQKFVRIYVEFDVDGKKYQITLGAAANPDTWLNNIDRIAEAEHKRTNESVENIKSRLIEEIREYKSNLLKLDKTPLIEIDPVEFSENLEAYKLTDSIRLQELVESATDDEVEEIKEVNGKYIIMKRPNSSEFKRRSLGFVVSDIYVVTDKNSKLKGKAVIYVSSDPTLTKDDLMEKYTPESHNIRMFVLDNMGVDITSLSYKNWQEIYKGRSDSNSATIPANLRQFGARAYQCMWNFRARLSNFINLCDEFESKNGFNFSDNNIQDLLRREAELYQQFKKENKTSFSDYLKSKLTSDEYNLWSKINEFNEETLKNNEEFRVGTDLNRSGLYVRTLVGSKTWAGTKEDVQGIYINPKLARQYLNILNGLFNEFDKIVKPAKETAIGDTIKLLNKKNEDGTDDTWFEQVGVKKLRFVDNNGKETSFDITASSIAVLPIVLKEFLERAKLYQKIGKGQFNRDYSEGKLNIELRDGDIVVDNIDYLPLFDLLEDGINQTVKYENPIDIMPELPLGVIPFYNDDLRIKGYKDRRIKNLFRVMFHGLTWTNKFNDFTGNEPRAFAADFHNGIFVDPLIKQNSTDRSTMAALVSSDPRFFSIDVLFGSAIGFFNFGKTSRKSNQAEVKTKAEEQIQTDPKINQILSVIPQNLVDHLTGYISLEDFIPNLNEHLKLQFNPIDRNISKDNFKSTYLNADENGNLIGLVDHIKKELGVNTVEFIDYSDEGKLIFSTENGNYEFDSEEYYDYDNTGITKSEYITADQKVNSEKDSENKLKDIKKKILKFIEPFKKSRYKGIIFNLETLLSQNPTILSIKDNLESLKSNVSDAAQKVEIQNIIDEINDSIANEVFNENACLI